VYFITQFRACLVNVCQSFGIQQQDSALHLGAFRSCRGKGNGNISRRSAKINLAVEAEFCIAGEFNKNQFYRADAALPRSGNSRPPSLANLISEAPHFPGVHSLASEQVWIIFVGKRLRPVRLKRGRHVCLRRKHTRHSALADRLHLRSAQSASPDAARRKGKAVSRFALRFRRV